MKRFMDTEMVSSTSFSKDETIIYRPPNAWPTNNRTRKFIRLPERQYSNANEFEMLRKSVAILLEKQDERGSYYSDKEYLAGDVIDDQLGGASMVAYLLSLTGPDEKLSSSLERAVRFHLEHLLNPPTPSRPFRYTRYLRDRDTSFDICNNLWCIWGGALVIRYGKTFLSENTLSELQSVMAETWALVSTDPLRDENPCHNQLLAYCDIGILYAHAVENEALVVELLDYYHRVLRPLRIFDRGHWIYTEFNKWDAHYALLSLSLLEFLFASTGDAAFAEDADEMALYLNERVSAGGYYWGGSRHNECGFDEFIQLPDKWALELDLNRLLLPEPSHLWRKFAMDGHWGRGLVMRMSAPLQKNPTERPLSTTPWHFRKADASVCLGNDRKLHHLSSGGLEIIPAMNQLGIGSGLTWLAGGKWKCDFFHKQPPDPSEGCSYNTSTPFGFHDTLGLATMQRGYGWETRQWWISRGSSLLWLGQVISHSFPLCEKISFLLGNPVLTRLGGAAVPVTEVETAEGNKMDTQGDAATVTSDKFLKFGDNFVGATSPLEFTRPFSDSFHTFPLPGGRLLRDCETSNELRVLLTEKEGRLDCRESLFFGVEIGNKSPSLVWHRDPCFWNLQAGEGTFEARQSIGGIWSYSFETPLGKEPLPANGFRIRNG